ncbi:MAG: hypothetical protein WC446_04545 [Candidatus Paceibacterota bacterium]
MKTKPQTLKRGFVPNEVHSALKSDVEIYKNSVVAPVPSGLLTQQRQPQHGISDTKLLQFFKDAGETKENTSKVVGENREPLPVWHITNEDFTKFETSKSRQNADIPAFFFATNKEDWKDMGSKAMPVFLNLRNLVEKPDANMQGSTVKEQLLEKGVDGTYVTEDGQVVEYAAFSPTQIKSATDNVGTFDNENEDIRFRMSDEADNEAINKQFNNELQQQIEGKLPKGHIYKLGYPSEKHLASGIADFPMEMSANTLEIKSSTDYKSQHPFDLEDVKDLPFHIHNPITIFNSEEMNGRKVILTKLTDKKGNNFIAILGVKKLRGRNYIEVNSIISLYAKDSAVRIGKWFDSEKHIGTNLLNWVDKNKALGWLANHSSNVNAVGLSAKRITNIIQEFENPTIEDKKDVRLRNLDQAGFYSTVEDALERLPLEKGTPDQMKAMLHKNG